MKKETIRLRLHRQIVRCRKLVHEYDGLEQVGMDCGVSILNMVVRAEAALFNDDFDAMKYSLEELKECD